MLSAEAGKVVDISEVYAADGTTVVVKNLFYNVPARRKFLKKDSTEAMNVSALVEKVALSRPDTKRPPRPTTSPAPPSCWATAPMQSSYACWPS